MMDKTFDPGAVEQRVAALWDEAEAFKAGRPERAGADRDAQPYTIVIPPPNVTGSLHMGHALNNTLQDILCRFERMRGRDVLWQPGTDHAGIATQMVVERQLAERGELGRRDLGREKFLEKVWAWKAESGGAIVAQLKRLGASCDWSRERFTMDEGLSKAVTKVFVQLYNERGPNGERLIYKDKRLVNWDPKLQTAISDLEVVQVECKGTFKWSRGDETPFDAVALGKVLAKNPNGHLYYFDYPVVDETGQPTNEILTVATTRPETMLGDTAVAVHPDDERYKHLHKKKVRLPIVGALIPIVIDDYSDREKGTGAVKITPGHDFNDFDVGKRHEMDGAFPPINVLDSEGHILLQGNTPALARMWPTSALKLGSDSSRDCDDFLSLSGLDRFEARRQVVEMMAERGLLSKIEPHVHTVPHGDRSGVVIEPRLTDQWYVDAKTLAAPALAAVRNGDTKFIPENWEKTYFQWLDNIQPWCISRQLWWGHRVPAWYGRKKIGPNEWATLDDPEILVATSEAEAIAVARERFLCDIRVLESPPSGDLDNVFQAIIDDELRGIPRWEPIWRDPDVLDTWFSSALWPFSTLGWPEETPELARYYPTNTLVTGFDIIFFWVARMMMMGLHFMGDVPFRDVYIHALVRDDKGAKMSKSKGNVIDPIGLIDQYGADSLRFTLTAMAAQGRDIKLSTSRVEGYRNFATKLWNAARFAEINGCVRVADFDPRGVRDVLNRWILGEAAKAAAEVTGAIVAYRFNDAANAAYRFVWNIVCDWYLELAKPRLQGSDAAAQAETRATAAFILDVALKLLHPMMPFITEELWGLSPGPARASVLTLAPWPDLAGLEDAAAEAEVGWVVDLVSVIRSVRSELNVPAATPIPLVLVEAAPDIAARVEAWEETIRRLARLDTVTLAAAPPPAAVQTLVRGTTIALPLEGVIDFAAERARLSKEIARVEGDAAKLDAKLANAAFVANAPEEVVEENRERLAGLRERREGLRAALGRLGA
jgi:valyl-tRNA synthetase